MRIKFGFYCDRKNLAILVLTCEFRMKGRQISGLREPEVFLNRKKLQNSNRRANWICRGVPAPMGVMFTG
jgi:hypothetical protein